MASESSLERSCRRRAEAAGCLLLKLWPLVAGLPDRLLLRPGGRVEFIEFKAPGEKPTRIQAFWHRRLRALGFQVHTVDSLAGWVAIFHPGD